MFSDGWYDPRYDRYDDDYDPLDVQQSEQSEQSQADQAERLQGNKQDNKQGDKQGKPEGNDLPITIRCIASVDEPEQYDEDTGLPLNKWTYIETPGTPEKGFVPATEAFGDVGIGAAEGKRARRGRVQMTLRGVPAPRLWKELNRLEEEMAEQRGRENPIIYRRVPAGEPATVQSQEQGEQSQEQAELPAEQAEQPEQPGQGEPMEEAVDWVWVVSIGGCRCTCVLYSDITTMTTVTTLSSCRLEKKLYSISSEWSVRYCRARYYITYFCV